MTEMIFTDDTTSVTYPDLQIPLVEETVNNDVLVQTKDNNVSLYISPASDKRVWRHTFAYMDRARFLELKGFRDRQRTLYKFPRITIANEGVNNVVVYMQIGAKNIIDDCGWVENVTIELRETRQNP